MLTSARGGQTPGWPATLGNGSRRAIKPNRSYATLKTPLADFCSLKGHMFKPGKKENPPCTTKPKPCGSLPPSSSGSVSSAASSSGGASEAQKNPLTPALSPGGGEGVRRRPVQFMESQLAALAGGMDQRARRHLAAKLVRWVRQLEFAAAMESEDISVSERLSPLGEWFAADERVFAPMVKDQVPEAGGTYRCFLGSAADN